MKTTKLLLLATALFTDYTVNAQAWLPGSATSTSQIDRTGITNIGTNAAYKGVGQFEINGINASGPTWDAYLFNGAGAGQVLRVKGGWKGNSQPLFQVEANNDDPNDDISVGNVHFNVLANGNTGIGLVAPQYRLHLEDFNNKDYGALIDANSAGPVMYIRKYSGTTPAPTGGAYTAGVTPALVVDNYTNYSGPSAAGAFITGQDIGILANALPRPGINFATAVLASSANLYPDNPLFNSTGVRSQATDGDYSYGVTSTGQAAIQAFGVAGGAYIPLYTTGSRTYGIYGDASGGGVNYAGYFAGDVYAAGLYLSSDAKLKTDVKNLTGSLEKINLLHPKTYRYKTDEYKSMHLREGENIGFIAQEVETVFPNLVKRTISPTKFDKDGKMTEKEMEFKTVDYISLIPVLTAGIQELNTKVEQKDAVIAELKKQLEELTKRVDQLSATNSIGNTNNHSAAYLEQNAPNPFTENTVISYYIPESAQGTAMISVYNNTGMLIRRFDAVKGKGQVQLQGNTLPAGNYTYELTIGDVKIDSKKMVLSK